MLKRATPWIRAIVLTLLIERGGLLACSCLPIERVCEAAWKADAVFLGTVTHVYPLTFLGFPLAWPFPTARRITFDAKETFSGPTKRTVEIRTAMGCCSCGMEFQLGQDYLVYAYGVPDEGDLVTGVCSRTSRAKDSASDLAYFYSLVSSPPPAHIYGFVTANPWDAHSGERATEPRNRPPLA